MSRRPFVDSLRGDDGDQRVRLGPDKCPTPSRVESRVCAADALCEFDQLVESVIVPLLVERFVAEHSRAGIERLRPAV